MIECAETTKARVDQPEFIFGVVGHFVDVDVAGDMDCPWQVTGVVFARRLQLTRHRRHIAQIAHALLPPDREARPGGTPMHRHPHGLIKVAKVGVKALGLLVITHQDHLARLIGRDDQADPRLVKEIGEGIGIDALKGRGGGLLSIGVIRCSLWLNFPGLCHDSAAKG